MFVNLNHLLKMGWVDSRELHFTADTELDPEKHIACRGARSGRVRSRSGKKLDRMSIHRD
jgi:hypothetical protein